MWNGLSDRADVYTLKSFKHKFDWKVQNNVNHQKKIHSHRKAENK